MIRMLTNWRVLAWKNQRSNLSRILVQRIRHECKVVFMTK